MGILEGPKAQGYFIKKIYAEHCGGKPEQTDTEI